MYTYIEVEVGRKYDGEENKIRYITKKYKDYKDVELFNYTMEKEDLFETLYHKFYNNNSLRAFIVVPQGKEEQGKIQLKQDIIKHLLIVENQLNEVIGLIRK
jgi:hypothetical protein